MSMPVDIRVPLSLHSDSLRELDGYSDDTAVLAQPTIEAFDYAYSSVGKLADALEASKKNGAWNENQRALIVSESAAKVQDAAARKFDSVRASLTKTIKGYEDALSQPVEAKASLAIGAEIRRYVKELPTEKRHGFLMDAMKAKDDKTLTAVLGAPGYLSGLTNEMAQVYTRKYHETMQPDTAQRLKLVRALKDAVDSTAPLLFGAVEKAMGKSWAEIKELRNGNTRALDALKFADQ